jgi:hypothetical protein
LRAEIQDSGFKAQDSKLRFKVGPVGHVGQVGQFCFQFPISKTSAGAVRKPNSVPRGGYPPAGQRSFIWGRRLPAASGDLPGSPGGPPGCAPLFGLAPGGVYRASPVTRRTGALLPHRFTLACDAAPGVPRPSAVYSLLHFPSRRRASTLWSTLPCGVRTFLRSVAPQRSFVPLRPMFLKTGNSELALRELRPIT